MSNKRYYWLKLKEDFFRDKIIKKLRKIAGGDTYTIIYLKLLLKSMETNGKLYYDGIEESFSDELALEIDEDKENVKITVIYLIKNGLLKEVNEQELEITRINEMIGSETNKAELMRKKRSKNKLIEVNRGNIVTSTLPDVTKCYTEIEKEKEKKIDKDIYIDIDIKKVRKEHEDKKHNSTLFTSSEKQKEVKDRRESFNQLIEEHIKKGVAFDQAQREVLKEQIKKFLQLRFMRNKGFTNATFKQFLEKLLDTCDYQVSFQIDTLNKSLTAGYNDVFEPDYNKIFENSLDRLKERRHSIIVSSVIENVNKKYSTDYQSNFIINSVIDEYILDEYYSPRYSEDQIINKIMDHEDEIIHYFQNNK